MFGITAVPSWFIFLAIAVVVLFVIIAEWKTR